jgi:hypothetical protein
MSSRAKFAEIARLTASLSDGSITESEIASLDRLLVDDPEAQAYYRQYVSLNVALEWMFVDKAFRLTPAADSAVGARQKSPVLGFLGGVVDYVSHSRTLMFWLLCGVFGLYFAVQLGSLLVSRFWAQNAAQVAEDRGAGIEKHGQFVDHPGSGTTGGKVVARLTNAVDCQWKAAGQDSSVGLSPRNDNGPQPTAYSLQPLDIGTEFRAGQKLNLMAGLAELTFDSGAKVILTGPALFDVTDALGGDLQVGKLTAKVPHTAAGFTVATPGGKVIDLGTEFGVKVRDDGAMNVIVYVGDVQVESGSGGGTGSGGTDQPRVVHVHAGEAVTVGPDHIAKPIPPENEHFVREIAPLGDPAKAEAAYVEFMKSLKPVVWFRMEGKETDRALHDEMGGKDAKLYWDGPGNPFVKGRIGKSLWLRGAQLKDGAIVPDYPKAEHSKLSVVAWAYAESLPTWASIAKNWSSAVGRGQFHFGLYSGDLCVFICQSDRAEIPLREGATHRFPLYEWQHVAFTTDGSTARLYRQGREVAAVKHSGLFYPVNTRALGIGEETDAAGASAGRGYWDGKLDEIAVFNDTLSADDIRKLAAAAPR